MSRLMLLAARDASSQLVGSVRIAVLLTMQGVLKSTMGELQLADIGNVLGFAPVSSSYRYLIGPPKMVVEVHSAVPHVVDSFGEDPIVVILPTPMSSTGEGQVLN